MATEGTHLYGDRAPHNEQFVVLSASSNLTLERVLTGTANQITITDGGAGAAVTLSVPSAFIIPGTITIPNTGLHILDTGGDHDLIIAPGSDLSADRQLTLTTGDAARTITLSGNPTLDDWFDQSIKVAASPTFAGITVSAHDGLRITENGGGFDFIIEFISNLTVDRTIRFNTGDADRSITLSGNPTLDNWFDQSVKVAASPTFADVFVPDGGTFGIAGNELLIFNAAGTAVFSGCNVGISPGGSITPDGTLHVHTASAGAVTAYADANDLVIENSTHGGINILTPNDKRGQIVFGDPDAPSKAWLRYDHNVDKFYFGAETHLMILDSTGTIQIKEAAAAVADTAGFGQLWVKSDAANILMFTDDAGADFTVNVTAV